MFIVYYLIAFQIGLPVQHENPYLEELWNTVADYWIEFKSQNMKGNESSIDDCNDVDGNEGHLYLADLQSENFEGCTHFIKVVSNYDFTPVIIKILIWVKIFASIVDGADS